MFLFYTVLVAFLQLVVGYHHYGHQARYTSSDNFRPELPQKDLNVNFNNFGEGRRSGRQISQFNFQNPTSGFDWDSDSLSWPRRENTFDNGNRRPSSNFKIDTRDDNRDAFIFQDEFESRFNNDNFNNDGNFNNDNYDNYVVRTTERSTERIPIRTSTVAIPGMGTPRTPCEDRCQTTPEYNPVCGDDNMTYFSRHRLICAQRCGKRVTLKHMGACSIIPPRG